MGMCGDGCNNCNCKENEMAKNSNEDKWDWSKFQKLIQDVNDKKQERKQDTKMFKLVIVDEGNGDWEVEYRTYIDVFEMAEVLTNYFGIEAEAFPKTEIVGYILDDEEEDDSEED